MEYKSEWSRRLVACSKGEDTIGVGETDQLISYIENLVLMNETLTDRGTKLLSQLPEGMKHCTILSKECEKGHAWLTATNWIQHGCETCRLKELEHLKSEKEAGDYPWNHKVTNAFDLLKRGGAWLGRVREFLQRKAIDGERLTWGSHEWVNLRSITVADMEYLAADIALAAQHDYQQDRERDRRFAKTINDIRTGKASL